MKLRTWCLICQEEVPLPKNLTMDEGVTLFDAIMWVNDNCSCPNCYFLPLYFQTRFRIGVEDLEEKLAKNTNETDGKHGKQERAEASKGIIPYHGPSFVH